MHGRVQNTLVALFWLISTYWIPDLPITKYWVLRTMLSIVILIYLQRLRYSLEERLMSWWSWSSYEKHFQVKKQSQFKFELFEDIDISKCSGGCMRIVTICRPPPSNANRLSSTLFFEEFSTLAEQLTIAPGNLLIVSDFNFHIDNPGYTAAIKFTSILELFKLKWHVWGHTQKKGHILDLLITRADDYLVTSIEVRDPMLSDHLAVHCKLGLQKTPPVQASIQYKKYALLIWIVSTMTSKSLHSCHMAMMSYHLY